MENDAQNLVLMQYQQWLADSQLQVATLAAENSLLKKQLADQAKPQASSDLVE